jgi:DNA polymerase V
MDVFALPSVGAGFPSPAESFFEKRLDLTQLLTPHPDFTYFTRVEGESMSGAGIHDGDILVVDRTLDAINNSIVVVILNGGFVVKRIQFREQGILLISEHHRYPLITVTEHDTFSIWGVVTYAIHAVGKRLTHGPVVPAPPKSPPQRRLPQ